MNFIGTYKTKAKWFVTLDEKNLPVVGYANDLTPVGTAPLDPGYNVILFGTLMQMGSARGRSSVSFGLRSACGWDSHATVVGMTKILGAVADHRLTISMDTWDVQLYPHTSYPPQSIKAPILTGYWTMAKQGTELSLIPAPESIIPG